MSHLALVCQQQPQRRLWHWLTYSTGSWIMRPDGPFAVLLASKFWNVTLSFEMHHYSWTWHHLTLAHFIHVIHCFAILSLGLTDCLTVLSANSELWVGTMETGPLFKSILHPSFAVLPFAPFSSDSNWLSLQIIDKWAVLIGEHFPNYSRSL